MKLSSWVIVSNLNLVRLFEGSSQGRVINNSIFANGLSGVVGYPSPLQCSKKSADVCSMAIHRLGHEPQLFVPKNVFRLTGTQRNAEKLNLGIPGNKRRSSRDPK